MYQKLKKKLFFIFHRSLEPLSKQGQTVHKKETNKKEKKKVVPQTNFFIFFFLYKTQFLSSRPKNTLYVHCTDYIWAKTCKDARFAKKTKRNVFLHRKIFCIQSYFWAVLLSDYRLIYGQTYEGTQWFIKTTVKNPLVYTVQCTCLHCSFYIFTIKERSFLTRFNFN